MAAFDAPKGVGARRVSRSIMSSGPGGTNYQNFDPFEAADANQSNFRLTSQDDEELEVTIPVDNDVGKKDVAVRFTARSLRVTVKNETLIDSPLKGRIYPDECSWSFGTASGTRASSPRALWAATPAAEAMALESLPRFTGHSHG